MTMQFDVVIIGAGPSGLTAAYYSAINGHNVTVFERQPQAGGMMRYGIPEYRLPKAILDKEIALIKNLGVKIITGKAVGTHILLADLQKDFELGYLVHLYTDKLWFNGFLDSLVLNNSIKLMDGTIINIKPEEIKNLIF